MFIALNSIVFYITEINKEQRTQIALNSHMKHIETQFNVLTKKITQDTNTIYARMSNNETLINILDKVGSEKNKKQFELYHDAIYQMIKDHYKYISMNGIYQFHFVLPDNRSFLRMHKPEVFGDNLDEVREDYEKVHKTKKMFVGVTGGKTITAYRRIYPLFTKANKYVGLLDIAYPTTYLQNELSDTNNLHSHLLVNKVLIKNKVWKMDETLEYTESIENSDYLTIFAKKFSEVHKKKCQLIKKNIGNYKNIINEKMHENKTFAISVFIKELNMYKAVSFLPLSTFDTEIKSWLVTYEDDEFITFTLETVHIIRAMFFLLFLLIFYSLYKLIYQKEELKNQAKNLELNKKELEESQNVAKLGTWSLNHETNELKWSDEIYSIFEHDKRDIKLNYDIFLELIHPADKKFVNRAFKESLKTKEKYSIEHRIVFSDGRIKWVKEQCYTKFDDNDKPIISIGAVQDITESKKLQTKLESERIKYKNLMENSSDAIIILDLDGIITECSKQAKDILGYENSQMKGVHIATFEIDHSKEDIEHNLKLIQYRPLSFETKYKRKDEKLIDVSVNIVKIDIEDKEHIYLSVRDITRQKFEIEQRMTKEAQLESITNASQDAILMMNPEGSISFWNPAASKIFGYSASEALGQNLHEFLVPKRYLSSFKGAFPEFLKSGTGGAVGKTVELNAIHKDGHEITVAISLGPVRLNGQWHAVGVIRDITQQKQIQSTLESERLKYKNLMENSSDAILVTDKNGLVIENSEQAGTLLGYHINEMIGMHVSEFESQHTKDEIKNNINMLAYKPMSFESVYRKKDNSLIDVSVNIVKIKIDEDELVYASF